MARHICKYNSIFCGIRGYEDLCGYCKRAADLELAQRGLAQAQRELDTEFAIANRIRAEAALREARRREANEAAARALGDVVARHPGATAAVAGGIAALFIGAAVAKNRRERK